MKILAIIFLLTISIAAYSQPKTYYVASNGNDANTAAQAQSQTTPWATTAKINSFMTSLNPGDTVKFRRGDTFTGFLICNKAGTSASRIVFTAYGTGAKPIITGFTDVTNWTNTGSNIWRSNNNISTLTYTNVVTVNNAAVAMGRTPNAGVYLTIASHTGHSQAVISSLTGSPNYTNAQLVARTSGNSYIFSVNTITSQATTALNTVPAYTNPFGFTIYDYANSIAFIQNSLSTLDVTNEWFYDRTNKNISIVSSASPTGVKVATIDSLVRISAGFLTFDNINFQGANTDCFQLVGTSAVPATNITIQNCDIRYVGDMGIQQQNFAPNLTVSNCTFRDIYNSGINNVGYGNNTGTQVIGNSFAQICMIPGAWGSLDGTNLAMGFTNSSSGDSIRLNTIDSVGYMGIFHVGTNFTIRNNFVNHYCYWLTDGGGIYMRDHGTGRNIIGNIVLNGMTTQAQAIYMDQNSSGANVVNNSVANAVLGIYFNDGHEGTVRGNTVFQCSSASLNMSNSGFDLVRNITIRKNIFVQTNTTTLGNCAYQDQPESTPITDFGTSDSNNISRPVGLDNNAWYTVKAPSDFRHFDLPGWQSASSYDLHSTRAPFIVTLSNIRFVYNASSSVSVQALGANYAQIVAPPGTTIQWNGSITLQPWTSAILLLNGTGPPPLTATAAADINPLTCFGNTTTVRVTATGGTSPYQYKLGSGSFGSSNAFSGLGAGTYSFTIQDATGTLASTSVTITQPSQITISETHTTITVNGGTSDVTVTASGGTGTKQYSRDGGAFQSSNVFSGVLAGNHTITVRDANLCTNTLSFTITQPSAISLSLAATTNPLTCYGNSTTITATATGGSSPYTYSSNGGPSQSSNIFTGIVASTYAITVTDALGASTTSTITITQPTQITITESHTTISVNGGTSTVTVTASGGTGTKNYSLDGGTYQSSNVFAGVAAGTHTITVRDANLCTNTLTFTITQPSALNVSAAATTNPLTCFGNTTTITVTAIGGTTPYQYQINGGTFQSGNTFSSRGAGTYTLTVRDAALVTQTTTLTITQPTQITISESHTTISINGGTSTVTVTASGGTSTLNYRIDGGVYQVSNSFSGILAGNHTITVRDANLCTNTLTFTITQPTALVVSAAVTTAIACNGGSGVITVTASGGTPPYQYKNGSGAYQSGATFSVTAGTYIFTVLDAGGSSVSTSATTITQPTIISVSVAVSGSTVTVTSSGGVGTLNYKLDAGAYQLSNVFNSVASGNHTVTVRDANSCTQSKAFNVGTALKFAITYNPIRCNGLTTTVHVNATGGVSPYTGTGDYVRAAGTWSFTVTDAVGARADTTITITQPAPLTISESYPPITINGGTTDVTITGGGGTGSFRYKLDAFPYQTSNTFFGVAAGQHRIYVADIPSNCTISKVFTITQPTSIGISLTPGTAIACNGGTTTMTVVGSSGTTPYTYGKNGVFQSSALFSNLSAATYTFSVKDAMGFQKDTIVTISQPTALSLSVSTGTIVANGGTTTVTASGSGGTGGLTYSLDGGAYQGSGSFSGVSAGSHTVTLKDANSCTTTNTFSISQPGALIIGLSLDATIDCFGGTVTATVSGSGGTTPYTYSKNGGTFSSTAAFPNLTAGTYTFSVKDAFGVQDDTIVTITQAPVIVISVATGTISVNGGTTTVTVTASGGTGSLTYSLDGGSYQGSNVFSGVAAGPHTVTVKDANSCTKTNTFSITQPGILYISVSITTNPLDCYGDQTNVTVSASGGTTPYTGTGSSNYSAGTYTISVTDAFGARHDTIITITQPPKITMLSVSQYPNPVVSPATTADSVIIAVAGGTPINDSVYEFKLDGGAFVQSDSAFQYTFFNVSIGNHTVTIRDANGCTQTYSFSVAWRRKKKFGASNNTYQNLQP